MTIQKNINFIDRKYEKNDHLVLLERSSNYLVVRFKHPTTENINDYFAKMGANVFSSFPDANAYVINVPAENDIDIIKAEIKKNAIVLYVGNAFVIDGKPVIYTENIIIFFNDTKSEDECASFFTRHNLTVKQQMKDIGNAWMVTPSQPVGSSVIELSNQILSNPDVEASYPEIIYLKSAKAIHPNQWHLKPTMITYQANIDASANVEEAHKLTQGGGITVAIIDDAIDITHPEFSRPGKVVYPANFSGKKFSVDPMPENIDETHGTACAGVAVASGLFGATGVAPAASLMPVRLNAGLGSINEAKAFMWAARNGADIISCSWGPADGDPLDPDDPVHDEKVKMAPHTKRAIEFAVKYGRKGKGCAIFFASGNGNESVDNDGYASHPQVMAVAACNSENVKSQYSDYGKAVFCAFPSSDNLASSTPGIWTTRVIRKQGDDAGFDNLSDVYGNYTNRFGGTSSACPGAAGIAALVLSVRPDLKLNELRLILKKSCDKIEREKSKVEKSEYGVNSHSLNYGYGRLNAAKAVRLAVSNMPFSEVI